MRQFDSFSSAIRAGIEMRPNQCFGKFFDDELDANCGLGAGIEGILERPLTLDDIRVWRRHPELAKEIPQRYSYMQEAIAAMPCECNELTDGPSNYELSEGLRLDAICVHLNNAHHWTREQIADWLQSVEDELFGYETITGIPEKAVAECPS